MKKKDYRKKIKTLQALLKSGSGASENEKRIAKRILQSYEEKGINIFVEEKIERKFNYENKNGKLLLFQIIAFILKDEYFERDMYTSKKGKCARIELTEIEYIEIKNTFEIYYKDFKKQYKKYRDLFLSAFIHKNNLYYTGKKQIKNKNEGVDFNKINNLSKTIDKTKYMKNLSYKK